MEQKICPGPYCNGKIWPITRFGKDKSCTSGYKTLCKMCYTNKRRSDFVPGICEKCKKKHDCSYGTGRFCNKYCSKGFSGSKRSEKLDIRDARSTKICSDVDCEFSGEEQPVENFYKRNNNRYRSRCKRCVSKNVCKYRSTLVGYLKSSFTNAKARAYKYDRAFNISPEYLHELWKTQNGKCAISGKTMTHIIGNDKKTVYSPFNTSIDRIDSSEGYVKRNIQLICVWIQAAKLDYDLDDFKSWIIDTAFHIANTTPRKPVLHIVTPIPT